MNSSLATPSKGRASTVWLWFTLGLSLRLIGLLFKGTHDLDQLVLEWGASVHQNGLANTPIIIYGVLSYVIHGLSFTLAEPIPNFWWVPQKAFEILAEVGIFVALVKLLPPARSNSVVWFYWLNPFFILSGAWLGFWDGPYTLTALLCVLALRATLDERVRWLIAGALLGTGAMFKPQGLLYFVIPFSIYLALDAVSRKRVGPSLWAALGGVSSVAAAGAFLVVVGGDPTAIPRSYLIGDIMPNLCNSCISVWRPATRILQVALGQSGALYELRLPGVLPRVLDRLILGGTMILVAGFVLRVSRFGVTPSSSQSASHVTSVRILRFVGLGSLFIAALGLLHHSDPAMHSRLIAGRYSANYAAMLATFAGSGTVLLGAAAFLAQQVGRLLTLFASSWDKASPNSGADLSPHLSVYLVLVFGALVIPQLGTRAHINHTYSALVLLIPLAIVNRAILIPWTAMVGAHLYGYLSSYGIGSSTPIPDRDISAYPEVAHKLIARVDPLFHRPFVEIHAAVGRTIHDLLPQEPLLSFISALQFVFVVYVVRELFIRLGRVDRLEIPLISPRPA